MPDYQSDAGLLSHLQKQNQTINEFKTEAGADADDITSIGNDTANLEFVIELAPIADDFKTSVFGVKRKLIRGEIGEALGTIMAAPSTGPPFALVAGIEKRSRERDGRFKRSKTMTEAARIGLDLVDAAEHIAPESVKPTLEVTEAQGGYEAAVVIGNRGKSSMWRLLGRKMNTETWHDLTSGTGKGASVTITPTTPGQPERMELKIQLYKDNEPYGQPSDPVYATFNP